MKNQALLSRISCALVVSLLGAAGAAVASVVQTEPNPPNLTPDLTTLATPWKAHRESGQRIYFLYDGSPRIERYDVHAGSWLTPIPLEKSGTASPRPRPRATCRFHAAGSAAARIPLPCDATAFDSSHKTKRATTAIRDSSRGQPPWRPAISDSIETASALSVPRSRRCSRRPYRLKAPRDPFQGTEVLATRRRA